MRGLEVARIGRDGQQILVARIEGGPQRIEHFIASDLWPKAECAVKCQAMLFAAPDGGAVGEVSVEPAINRNVPEQPVALPREALLRGVLSRQMQLRRIAKRRIHDVMHVRELMSQEAREFFGLIETFDSQARPLPARPFSALT